jgi:hypothetical protein
VRALLIEEGWHATLPLAGALADAGHAVTVLTANGTRARCLHRSVLWRSGPAISSPAFPAHVAQLIADHGFEHVLPLTEAAMARLWDVPGPWTARLHPTTAAWQRPLLRSKHALTAHMAAHGVAVPAQILVEEGLDLGAAIGALGLPLVVKGATGSGGKQVRIVEDRAALGRALAWARGRGGAWALQEFIAGPTYLVGGVFDRGAPVRIYAAEKRAQHPPRTGGAIHLRSTDDLALLGLGIRALRALAWTGLASVDVMSRPDGRPVLLEVNPRLWGSYAGAASAGVDLFTPWIALLEGRAPAPDLRFAADDDCLIFPRYLNDAGHRNLAGARQALRDLRGAQGRDWRDLRFTLHILWRLFHMKRQAARSLA